MTIAVNPWVGYEANAAVVAYLAEKRLGCKVTKKEVDEQTAWQGLDSGEIAAHHRRSYARHRTISDLEHLRLLKLGRRPSGEPEVEQRPLARYDALIPA